MAAFKHCLVDEPELAQEPGAAARLGRAGNARVHRALETVGGRDQGLGGHATALDQSRLGPSDRWYTGDRDERRSGSGGEVEMSKSNETRVALVTGGTRGLGRALTMALAN